MRGAPRTPEDEPDPSLVRAAAQLRAEWRADEELWTREAFAAWNHGLAMADVIRDVVARGERLQVILPSTTLTGTVTAVGGDALRLATGAGPVDVALGPSTPCLLRTLPDRGAPGAPSPGGRATGDAGSFRARLLEHEGSGVEVEVGSEVLGTAVRGRLRVARDHVRIDAADGVAYLPVASVSWVRPVP